MTTLALATSGTAKTAPAMPPKSEPALTESTTPSGCTLTACPMMSGVIDYRRALAFAISHGFKGAILCENYGGDGLSVSAENARYVRGILGSMA